MGWLPKLPFGRGGAAVAEAVREDESSVQDVRSGPPLMVLVSDASGRASFKTYVFDDIASATEWVKYWFPLESGDPLTAFWAMTERPETNTDAAVEALVLISDFAREGVVYLFSFVDIASAEEFMREEVEHGTSPDAMNLYWAVQVKREINRLGEMILVPSTPPGTASLDRSEGISEDDGWVVRDTVETIRAPEEPVGDSRQLMEEAPNARTGVAEPTGPAEETFELTSWMERARKKPVSDRDIVRAAAEVVAASEASQNEAAPARALRDDIIEPPVESETAMEAASAAQITPDGAAQQEATEMLVVGDAPDEASPETAIVAEAAAEEAVAEAETEVLIEAAAVAEQASIEDLTSPQEEGFGTIEHSIDHNGHRNGHGRDNGQAHVHETNGSSHENGDSEDRIDIRIGIQLQSKALKIKRWEVKDEPFEGFNSPPGRF